MNDSPEVVLLVPVHSRMVAVYDPNKDFDYTRRSILVLGKTQESKTYSACVLNKAGQLVFADSLPGFVGVEEDI